MEPGYHYCKGLLHRWGRFLLLLLLSAISSSILTCSHLYLSHLYLSISPYDCVPRHRWTNAPREALKAFNFARKDTKWGAQALLHMVEVRCLVLVGAGAGGPWFDSIGWLVRVA